VVVIRSASPADAAQIAAVQRASWLAAYQGIISRQVIDRVTTPDGGARIRQSFRTRPWQRMIAAVSVPRPQAPGQASGQASGQAGGQAGAQAGAQEPEPAIVGYASFGPELDVLGAPWPHPPTTAGAAGRVAELYALYVHPDWWSTGTGRALMDRSLARVCTTGYTSIMLWVLQDNARARRFYGRAGFAADGARHVLDDLEGVTEIRYRRALSG
jgi:GNAT superfamily N-acetyltransferase